MPSRLDYPAAVGAAVRAPSLHNSQPWRFRLRVASERSSEASDAVGFTASERSSEASDAVGFADGIEVRLDPRRRLPASDPTGWAARLAAGAVVLNLRLALAAQGWETRVRLLPDRSEPYLLALVELGRQRPATPVEQRLCQAIWHRHSNRAPFWRDEVPADARAKLVAAAAAEDAWLALLIGPGPVNALAEIARTANQVLMRSAAYRAELAAWTRESRAADDGVPADAGGPRPEPQDLLPQRPFGDRPRGPGHDFEPQPLVAVLGTVDDTPGDQLVAGQALQRVLLTATDAQLAVSMVSQPIEIPRAREQLRLALHQFGTPQMVLRIGYGQPGRPTPRRPVEEFIDQEAVAEAVSEP